MARSTSDPIEEELKRSHSLSLEAAYGVKSVHSEQTSTLSLEGLDPADIDAIVNKRWMLDEVIGLVRSRLAILSGGRDKRGAPIITITCNEHSEVGPINIGKLLAYLSKVVDESLQGKGFTVLLDMQKASWMVTKRVLKSLQLTFVEHIHHVFVIKPRAFWQKRKVGVSLSMHKAKYNFPVVLLDSISDLFQYIGPSQIQKELGGTLVYNHDGWIEAQKCLEKHVLDLKGRLEGIESLREQLEQNEDPADLNEARDAVRRHVEARPLLDKGGLDTACDAAIHAVHKLKGCNHADVTAWFNRIDELCGVLQSTRGTLQQMWDEKGGKLDQVLQLRIFENDSGKLREWIEYEGGSLSREHTDIGDSPQHAMRAKQNFAEFTSRVNLKSQELKRVTKLGEKLVAANHYAAEQIKGQSSEVKVQWEGLVALVEERELLLNLAISFFDQQEKCFDNIDKWSDICSTKDTPDTIEGLDKALNSHKGLHETYQTYYTTAREAGHKIIEKLRRPVGDSSLPQAFVARTRVVKEILESLYDEMSWLNEQWTQRNRILEQTLCLKKYQLETKEIYEWLERVGGPFLVSSNSVGKNEPDATKLLETHDTFEKTTSPIYTLASQLSTKATDFANSGQANPDLIEKEKMGLERAINAFHSQLDGRRETIVQTQELYQKIEVVLSQFKKLTLPLPRSQFITPSTSELEDHLSKYLAQHKEAATNAIDIYTCSHNLLGSMKEGSKVKDDAGVKGQSAKYIEVDYLKTVQYLEKKVEDVRAEVGVACEVCERRERLWTLSIQFNQLEPNVDKHMLSLESWTQEQEHLEWEPATNQIDAQLQLDAFQRQYNQFLSSHEDLVSRGRSVAKALSELDLMMFGSVCDSVAVRSVEVWVVRLEGACARMKEIGGRKIEKLKSCLQFFLLRQRATKLTSVLTTLSSSLSLISGVGETLDNAHQIQRQATELNNKAETASNDIEEYCNEVEDCVRIKHFQATSLRLLAKSLQEKNVGVIKNAADKLKVATAAVEFHENVKNLYTSMSQYEEQLNSEDGADSRGEVEQLVKASNELHSCIQQAKSVVQSNGRELEGLVREHSTQTLQNKTFSLDDYSIHGSPKMSRKLQRETSGSANQISALGGSSEQIDAVSPLVEKRRSVDFLESKPSDSQKLSTGTPKLLVAPRRATGGMKAAKSMPALGPSVKDQQIIEKLLMGVATRMNEFEDVWSGRIARLKQWDDVITYRDDAKKVIEWVESVGETFLERKNNFGRSIEEAKTLLDQCQSFEKQEVQEYSQLMQQLDSSYQSLPKGQRSKSPNVGGQRSPLVGRRAYSVDTEGQKSNGQPSVGQMSTSRPALGGVSFSMDGDGHRSLEQQSSGQKALEGVHTLHCTLEKKWSSFERDFRRYDTKLDLSLRFHEIIFEASNWCQTSQKFLDKMEDRVDLCTSAGEATELLDELTVYMSVTKDQQSARVEQLKHTSEFLHSSTFMDLTNQVARSTSRTVMEAETCERSLKKMVARFNQIESEKDRKRRLIKQREHVLEELLETEVTFVADLKLILKCRPRFLRADMLPNSLKGKENIIFGNINEIEAFHRTCLLPRLQQHAKQVEGTASLFVEFADEMKNIYVPFCRDKSASEELLASHRSYLNRVQSLFVTDVPLSSLLIKPVQRITKYPLLLKDLLKYTSGLGEPTSVLEEALKAVERIPVATNNALHLSYLENSAELVKDLGDLVCQGILLVSDSKFGIKAEKERQVFAFQTAILFARKVEVDRLKAKFKYEFKSKLAISPVVQILEFIEGEPCKFALVTPDSRLHLKSHAVETKQDWVRALRSSVLQTTAIAPTAGMENGNGLLSVEKDLMVPSPYQSPVAMRKSESLDLQKGKEPARVEFDQYVVKEDFYPQPSSPDDTTLSLSKGDIVEVLDNNIDGKWFIRTKPVLLATTMHHGWVPSSILERVETESTDGKKGWVQITAGPLSGGSDDDKWKALRQNQTAFGSHDLQSQQVINTLKKVTFGAEVKESDGGSSLDKGERVGGRQRSHTLPELHPPDVDHTHLSPHSAAVRTTSSPSATRKHTEASLSVFEGDDKSPDWTKTQWRKKVIKRKRSGDPRSDSMSSDLSELMEEELAADKLQSSSSEEAMDKELDTPEPDAAKVEKAKQKIGFIMAELLQTEKDYVERLEQAVNGFLKEMQSPNLPDSLKGKEKLIFGNIQEVYKFHSSTFLKLLEENNDSLEKTASCFNEHAHQFEVYVTYCENKPKSESFIWTYQHTGGTFFEEVQTQLGHKHGIDSFLIKPVQRITKYKLLLSDLHKTAKKAQLETPNLEKALTLMEEIPKRANDAMTLSMICGYDGNIHSFGQLIAHDDFTVYERSRRTAAKRHVFLLDQRLILTKEKDADGLYSYKDSLKLRSLSVAEKEGDNPCRFAVGTGSVDSWEQYYILEAGSPEKKREWVQSIKDILKGQFELLQALQAGPRMRSKTFDVSIQPLILQPNNSVAMINLSDDSEQEDEEYQPPTTPKATTLPRIRGPTHTVAEPTPSMPVTEPRSFNMYIVAEDCAPPKDNEGIMYIRKGQIYDVLDSTSDWWLARLIRDVGTEREVLCEQGWVPGSFLDKYNGKLSHDEEHAVSSAMHQKRLRKLTASMKKELSVDSPSIARKSSSNTPPVKSKNTGENKRKPSPKRKKSKNAKKVMITSSLSFQEDLDQESLERNGSFNKDFDPKGPEIVTPLSNETILTGRSIQFKCEVNSDVHPIPNVTWSHDGVPLSIDRAFTNYGEKMCVLRVNEVQRRDEGTYTCTISNKMGVVSSKATLTVLSPPDPPGRPVVRPLTSSSVGLTWDPPSYTGNSNITIYLVECKDTLSNRWSTLMKRITEPSTTVNDLMPGSDYVFRVVAGNQIGSSEPSAESASVQMAKSPLSNEFSLDRFDEHYQLLDEIGHGRFGVVYECVHSPTQQMYAAKLLPLQVGKDHAQHELSMLSKLAHPNVTQMSSAYLTQQHFVILFQLINRVNLFEFFVSQDHVTESDVAASVVQVVSGLHYLHQMNIAHLAIRPENILTVEAPDSDIPHIKLIHFERSKVIETNSDLCVSRLEGSIEFEAPEILLNRPVSMETDMWSLGVVLYTLVSGSSPYSSTSVDLTKDNIVNGSLSFPSKTFKSVSSKAKDLIKQLLVVEKSNRLSSSQCQKDPWLTKPPSFAVNLDKLRQYISTQKWSNTNHLKSASYSVL